MKGMPMPAKGMPMPGPMGKGAPFPGPLDGKGPFNGPGSFDGKGFFKGGMPAKGGLPMLPQMSMVPHFAGGMMPPQQMPCDHAAKGQKGAFQRPETSLEDWASLGRQRQSGAVTTSTPVPDPGNLSHIFQQSRGTDNGFFQASAKGGSRFRSRSEEPNGPFPSSFEVPKQSGGTGRYTTLFAQPTNEDDWASLGKVRGSPSGSSTGRSHSVEPQSSAGASSCQRSKLVAEEDAPEDSDWSNLFAESSSGRTKPDDWSSPVPDHELKWHAEAAQSAKLAVSAMEAGPQTGPQAGPQAGLQARRFLAQERNSSRAPPKTRRHEDEVRNQTLAEDLREADASEARRLRQLELQEIERQQKRDTERKAKLSASASKDRKAYVPRRGSFVVEDLPEYQDYQAAQASEARALRELEKKEIDLLNKREAGREAQQSQQKDTKPYVPPTGSFLIDSPIEVEMDGDDYQQMQAVEARQFRELELKEIEKQKQRDVERESKVATDKPSRPYVPPSPVARMPSPSPSDPEEHREALAAEAKAFRKVELEALEREKQRQANREAKLQGKSGESTPYVAPVPVAPTLLQNRVSDVGGKRSPYVPQMSPSFWQQ